MKILLIMGYSLEDFYQYKKDGNEHQVHHFYGYDILKENENIEIVNLSPDYNNKRLKYFAKMSKLGNEFFRLHLQLKAARLSKNFDLIYSPQDIHLPLLAILRMFRVCKCPIFSISHFAYNLKLVQNRLKKIYKYFERYIVYKGIDEISFLNERLLELAITDYNVPERHRSAINWGADIEFFNNYISKQKDPPALDYFIAIGSANRDYRTLVQAFEGLDQKLIIIGRKDESNGLIKIPDNVIFDNSITPGKNSVVQLRKFYYNAIAVLIPLSTDNDVSNGATVFIEALAMGKPIIITDLQANYFDVEKEGIGYKVKLGDIQGWKQAISKISASDSDFKEMCRKSKELALTKCNYKIFSINILSKLTTKMDVKFKY